MEQAKYKPVLKYIENYWQVALPEDGKRKFKSKRNMLMQIGRVSLPGAFLAPNHTYFAGTQFYWDSYFTILGLVSASQADLAKSMVDNLCFLQRKFGLVPARNSLTSIGRTQPPYLTSMALEVYGTGQADKVWMGNALESAKQEYKKVWTSGRRLHNSSKLSRYHPRFFSNRLTVFESGWDKSIRFDDPNILPVDLNCLLYKYEADFLAWATECQDQQSQKLWQAKLNERRRLINQYFWSDNDGFFYDYSLSSNNQLKLKTLAGFYPLWCGAASQEQAKKCRDALVLFEATGGLTSTEKVIYTNRQWDYPNGWAPLQWIVIEGLRRYGYNKDAKRVAYKWLDCNLKVFKETGCLWEKYDVVNCAVGLPGRYPTQAGFAWTNSIFLRLSQPPGGTFLTKNY